MGIVTGVVLMFSLTFTGLVWLVRDVDGGIAGRAMAQGLAFQAARAGAQEIDPSALRLGGTASVRIDPSAAEAAARSVIRTASATGGGSSPVREVEILEVRVGPEEVEVRVQIRQGSRIATGHGVARAVMGP